VAAEHKSDEKEDPPAPLVDDVDFEVAHGPFAAHVDKNDISVNQVGVFHLVLI